MQPLLLFLFLLLSCLQKQDNLSSPQSNQVTPKNLINEQNEADNDFYGDTVHISDFIIQTDKYSMFELIKRGQKPQKETVGDTLYKDDNEILLGDFKAVIGVYKKFSLSSEFEDYKVKSIYKCKLAKPNFSTDSNAHYFRIRIREGCKSTGVDFAGHYTIIEWGCGTECQNLAVVDRINGKILFTNVPFEKIDGYYGVEYHKDSRMIIVNSYLFTDHPFKGYCLKNWREPFVFVFENDEFRQVEGMDINKYYEELEKELNK